MIQPEGLQQELLKLSRESRQWVLSLSAERACIDGVKVERCPKCGGLILSIEKGSLCMCPPVFTIAYSADLKPLSDYQPAANEVTGIIPPEG